MYLFTFQLVPCAQDNVCAHGGKCVQVEGFVPFFCATGFLNCCLYI